MPITWLCKKQGAVSHSSSEAEIIALEAALRAEGIPALMLWDLVIDVFHPQMGVRETNASVVGESSFQAFQQRASVIDHLVDVDSIPVSQHNPKCLSELVILEDNEAVIKMTIKGRSTAMRHVQRTHRVNLDWLYERFLNDKGIRIRYLSKNFRLQTC